MKVITKKKLNIVLTLAIVIALCWYLFTKRNEFYILSEINIFLFVLLTLANILYLFINAIFLKILFSKYKINLKMPTSFGLTVLTVAANYFSFIWGGVAVRAIYFKRKFQLSYPSFLNITLGSYLIIFFVSSVVASLVIILLSFSLKKVFYLPLIFFVSMALFSTLLIQLPVLFENFFIKWIAQVTKKWKIFREDKKLILSLAAITLLNLAVAALITFLKFKVLGINLGLLESFYISAIVSLAVIINLTPASLGITEALTAFAANALSINPVHAILATTVDRFSVLIIIFFLAPIFNYYLFAKDK